MNNKIETFADYSNRNYNNTNGRNNRMNESSNVSDLYEKVKTAFENSYHSFPLFEDIDEIFIFEETKNQFYGVLETRSTFGLDPIIKSMVCYVKCDLNTNKKLLPININVALYNHSTKLIGGFEYQLQGRNKNIFYNIDTDEIEIK